MSLPPKHPHYITQCLTHIFSWSKHACLFTCLQIFSTIYSAFTMELYNRKTSNMTPNDSCLFESMSLCYSLTPGDQPMAIGQHPARNWNLPTTMWVSLDLELSPVEPSDKSTTLLNTFIAALWDPETDKLCQNSYTQERFSNTISWIKPPSFRKSHYTVICS